MLFKDHIKSPFFVNAKIFLTILLENQATRCACPHNCYFLSVSHTIFALTQKMLERMKLPGQKKQKNNVMTQAGKN